jgi:hypothetical protein
VIGNMRIYIGKAEFAEIGWTMSSEEDMHKSDIGG